MIEHAFKFRTSRSDQTGDRVYFDVKVEVWLFGLRVDDAAKGGDVKLYVYSGFSNANQLAARFDHD
jgi:hypothetical protein